MTELVNSEVDRLNKSKTKTLPKYIYPYHVVTAAIMQKYSKYGITWKIHRKDCARISGLDAQKKYHKSVYGGGLLLSDEMAAAHADVARDVAENKALSTIIWNLSEREKEIVKNLSLN